MWVTPLSSIAANIFQIKSGCDNLLQVRRNLTDQTEIFSMLITVTWASFNIQVSVN